MRRNRNKRRDQQRHAQKRALERTGLNISANRQDEIVGMIQRGECVFVRKDSRRVSLFDVEFEQETLRVAYDKQRKSIATIMTKDFQ